MPPVRMPLHIGVDALWRTAWASALLVPSVLLLLGAPGADDLVARVVMGVVGLLGAALFLLLAYLARAADAVFESHGLRIEGGQHDGLQLRWDELASVELRGTRRPDEQDLSLWVRTKAGRELCIAEAARDLEKDSVRALHETLRAALGETAPPPPRNADLPRCTHCGAPLVPSAQPSQPCGACGVPNTMPPEIRERVAAQQHLDAARDAKAASIQLLLAQPGAKRAVWSLVAAGSVSGVVWLVVFGLFVSVGLGELGGFELGSGWFSGLCASFASFAFARIAIANRRALLLLCTDFAARPAPARGGGPGCRECGAPLPLGAGLVAKCVYCGAESVLGIQAQPLLQRGRAHLGSIEELVEKQAKERKWWRDIAILGTLAALAGGFWLLVQVVVLQEFVEERARCGRGDADACYEVASDYWLGISVAKNEAKSTEYYERACDDDHAEACRQLGTHTYYGWGTERDERRGKKLLAKACELESEEACDDLEEIEKLEGE